MFSLWARPAISSDSADWIVSCYGWAIQHFDGKALLEQSVLVTPSPEHFPKKVNNRESMAAYIFERVVALSGLTHWPFCLINIQTQGMPGIPGKLGLEANRRFVMAISMDDRLLSNDEGPVGPVSTSSLAIAYIPEQLKKPQDLTATFAHTLAQHMVLQAAVEPPGGAKFFAQASEVLASFLGFGVLLANSAYTFKGGCGSCYNPVATRSAALSEAETVFSLAVFCQLKSISNKQVFKYLKKHLRPTYRASLRQLEKSQYPLFDVQSKKEFMWDHTSR